MRLLVLGGTGFVGGAVVADALRRHWDVTVFNRGVTAPPPDGVRQLVGDRLTADGIAALAGHEWDLAVDTWDLAPRAVLDAATALADSVPHYVYVSSRSVYRTPVDYGVDETAPVVVAAADATDVTYAEMKAGGERGAAVGRPEADPRRRCRALERPADLDSTRS
jgi:2'-hydroxyisoflavone reductase